MPTAKGVSAVFTGGQWVPMNNGGQVGRRACEGGQAGHQHKCMSNQPGAHMQTADGVSAVFKGGQRVPKNRGSQLECRACEGGQMGHPHMDMNYHPGAHEQPTGCM